MECFEFRAIIRAPYFANIPPEIDEKWSLGSKKAAPKTYKGIKKAIKTRNDYDEKIGDKLKKTIASFINPEFVSRTGQTYKNIMDKTKESLAQAGKGYLKGIKDVYETGRFEEKVEQARRRYAQKWCEYLGPLKGYKAGHILGLSTMAVMALAGDSALVDYLKEQNIRFDGKPLAVTTLEKINEFKNILTRQIVRWGSQIIELGYETQDIKQANDEINRLVNEYLREGIAPFTSGGPSPRNNRDSVATSHIDFVVEEIPDPIKPGMRIKQLGLDIQVVME